MIELIPNWHPVWVHFAIALLITGALAHVVAFTRKPKEGAMPHSLIVARWTLWLGVIAAGLALLTGFWAASSVAHDDVAHANMMVHRNWAIAALVLFVLAAAVEWLRRAQIHASALAVVLSLAGGVAIAVTGFEGGQNVYEHGLGVQRLPDVGGHDHGAHGHGEDGHGDSTDDHGDSGGHDDGHDHGPAEEGHDDSHEHEPADTEGDEHDHSAHDHGEAPAADPAMPEEDGHDHGDHDHGPAPQATAGTIDTGELAMIGARFSEALATGNRAAVAELVNPEVLIFESGNVEASRAEYEGHHMPADMAFLAAMDRELISRQVIELDDDGAVVTTRSRLFGHYRDQDIDVTSTETLVLKQTDGLWQIVHIHWSSS